MTYEQCIKRLRILVENTDPDKQLEAIRNFSAATSLVDWVAREDKDAHGQFGVFLSYFEIFALLKDDEAGSISRDQCLGELVKLPMHLPKEG